MNTSARVERPQFAPFIWAFLLVTVSLLILFYPSLKPTQALLSNDAPLGTQHSEVYRLPGGFTGIWIDSVWIGINGGSFSPNLSSFMSWFLGPVGYAKFYAPLSLLLLGLSAWMYARQQRFHRFACLLVGIAAALNTNLLSNATWGLASRALTIAAGFLALTALVSDPRRHFWIKSMLGGLAVGLGLMEGGDNGAFLSLYIGAYALFQAITAEGTGGRKWLRGIGRLAVVVLFAGLIAAQTLSSLVGTQIKGISGAGSGEGAAESAEVRWDFATQWSLPKLETLRVIVPGLFGYRMDRSPEESYWGRVGQQPGWDEHHQGFPRHSGAGEYAGILVVLGALWAIGQSFRKSGGVFTVRERRFIWFWSVLALISLLLSWGRHAPFYQFVYALPYFSSIRNPMKLMHPFHFILLILFAQGLDGMARAYFGVVAQRAQAMGGQAKGWWARANGFDRGWALFLGGFVALSVIGYLVYSTSLDAVTRHLSGSGFEASQAEAIARFSLGEVRWYLFFLLLTVGALFLLQRGTFAHGRWAWATALLGFLLVVDLCRADAPWLKYYDYKLKYAANPMVEIVKERPFDHRVTTKLTPLGGSYLVNNQGQVYAALMNEWVQHHFPYFDVQSLDIVQMPRVPQFDRAIFDTFGPGTNELAQNDFRKVARLWQLTNTRYLLGMSGFLGLLNEQMDPVGKGFVLRQSYAASPKPGVTEARTVEDITLDAVPNGPFALFELTNVLPRVKLFGQWQVSTNDQATLAQLAEPNFPYQDRVLVSGEGVPPPGAGVTNFSGTAETVYYDTRHRVVRTEAASPSILLVNDRWDAEWRVEVDGKAAPLLRGNYAMRAVALPAGQHEVRWSFHPNVRGLYLSFGALFLGLLLCGFLAWDSYREPVNGRPGNRPVTSPKP